MCTLLYLMLEEPLYAHSHPLSIALVEISIFSVGRALAYDVRCSEIKYSSACDICHHKCCNFGLLSLSGLLDTFSEFEVWFPIITRYTRYALRVWFPFISWYTQYILRCWVIFCLLRGVLDIFLEFRFWVPLITRSTRHVFCAWCLSSALYELYSARIMRLVLEFRSLRGVLGISKMM